MEVASAHVLVADGHDTHTVLHAARSVLHDIHGVGHATLQVESDAHAACDDCPETW